MKQKERGEVQDRKVSIESVQFAVTLLTWAHGTHGKFGLRKSQISKRKVSGLAFIRLTYNWPSVEDSTSYSFHEISVYKSTHPKSCWNCNVVVSAMQIQQSPEGE